jgi:hypothetical protein
MRGQQRAGEQGQGRAGHEGDRRAVVLPEQPEHDAGREGPQSLDCAVPPECGGAQRRRREIRDQRLLRSLDRRRVGAVDHEPADQSGHGLAERKPGIDDRVDDPPADDQRAPADSVGPDAGAHGDQGFDCVLRAPEQRQPHQRHSGLRQLQQQERVRGVAERKDAADEEVPLQARGKPIEAFQGGHRFRRCGAGGFGHSQQRQDGEQAGNDGQREEQAVVVGREVQKHRRQQWSDRGAGVIHGPVIAKHAATLAWRRERGQHGVARGAAQAFAHAIGDANRKDVRPAGRNRDERPDQRRQRVAEHDDRLADAGAIGPAAGDDLEQAAGGVGRALDGAERHRGAAKDLRDEDWKQRIDGFGGRVGEEADPAEQPDRMRQALRRSRRAHVRTPASLGPDALTGPPPSWRRRR